MASENHSIYLMLSFLLVLLFLVLLLGKKSKPPPPSSSSKYLCNQKYALCTSAACVPHPSDHNLSICSCDVQSGPSMSSVPCEQLVPQIDKNGIETVYSTFSLEQFSDKKSLICNGNYPYSWCLNKICTVDPMNPEKALCICDVKRENSSSWTTLGGECDSSTCQNAYWSGASLSDLQNGHDFLQKGGTSPIHYCSGNAAQREKFV
jgi:hypothetical protein